MNRVSGFAGSRLEWDDQSNQPQVAGESPEKVGLEECGMGRDALRDFELC